MPEERIHVCLTCDVEGNPSKWMKELSRLMRIIDRYEARTTLFLSLERGIDSLPKHEIANLLHSLERRGHEIGLHIHWGSSQIEDGLEKDSELGFRNCKSFKSSLRSFTREEIADELEKYLDIMSELGLSPVSFRGGGLCQTTECLRILNEHGFKIDSSVAPGLDEASGWHQEHANVPYDRGYYYPSKADYARPANNENEKIGILEVPVSRMRTYDTSWNSVLDLPIRNWEGIYDWVVANQEVTPKVITPLCHTYMIRNFGFSRRVALSVLREVLHHLRNEEDVVFTTMKELRERLEE